MNKNLAGKIQTVLGPIDPERLGVTLTHEHLLSDVSVIQGPPDSASAKDFYHRPVSQDMMGRIRYHAAPNADNTQFR